MSVAVAIVIAAIDRLWDGKNEEERYTCNDLGKDRYACHAVVRAAMPIFGLDFDSASEHVKVVKIHRLINERIKGHYTASTYLMDYDKNYEESCAYVQNFRKQMLLDIHNQLMEEAQG